MSDRRSILVRSRRSASASTVASYRRALAQQPRRSEWRFELARLLYSLDDLPASRRELLIVLEQNSQHGDARHLLEIVAREMTEQQIRGAAAHSGG